MAERLLTVVCFSGPNGTVPDACRTFSTGMKARFEDIDTVQDQPEANNKHWIDQNVGEDKATPGVHEVNSKLKQWLV